MKKIIRIAVITTAISILIGCLSTSDNNFNDYMHVLDKECLIDDMYQSEYENMIEYIKGHEGYLSKPYACPAGYLTIGYGHLIKESEKFTELNPKQAEELLRNDFDESIKLIQKSNPNLNKLQILALSHFSYSLGFGTYTRSTLKKLIESEVQDLDSIYSIWNQYSYYRDTKGKVVYSTMANKLRNQEFQLFKQGYIIEKQYEMLKYNTDVIYYTKAKDGSRTLL